MPRSGAVQVGSTGLCESMLGSRQPRAPVYFQPKRAHAESMRSQSGTTFFTIDFVIKPTIPNFANQPFLALRPAGLFWPILTTDPCLPLDALYFGWMVAGIFVCGLCLGSHSVRIRPLIKAWIQKPINQIIVIYP